MRADHNKVEELAQSDNIERRIPVHLVVDVDSGGILNAEESLRDRRVAEDPDAFLREDCDRCSGNLALDGNRLEVEWDIDADAQGRENEPEALLGSVVVACE